MDEPEIIKRLQESSERALDAAYNLYAERLLSFCFAYTKSREESEDIVQEVFLKLWDNRTNIHNQQTLRPFLFTVAHRKIIDSMRQRIHNVVFEDYVAYREKLTTNETSLDYDKYVDLIKLSLDKLPASQRNILERSKFEGKSIHEISEELNISEKTVKNNISLGNKLLVRIIKNIAGCLFFFIWNA